jgi:hypothetical protein
MASRRRGFSGLPPPACLPVVVLVVCLAAAVAVSGEPLPQYYNAIFSFGDSFSDTGNFVIINSGKLPNMPKFPPPYARCSNGRLVIDFLGKFVAAIVDFHWIDDD